MRLGQGIEAAKEVGRVRLDEARPVPRVLLVVLVDTPGGEHGAVNAPHGADIHDIQRADHVGSDRFQLVVLAPVDIGAPGAAGCDEDVCRTDPVELLADLLALFHPDCAREHRPAVSLEQAVKMSSNPARGAPDQEDLMAWNFASSLHRRPVCRHCVRCCRHARVYRGDQGGLSRVGAFCRLLGAGWFVLMVMPQH